MTKENRGKSQLKVRVTFNWGFLRQLANERHKRIPALLEVGELIVAFVAGAEQDDIAGDGDPLCEIYRRR